MRSIWKGTISFGLVNIPIALGVATQRSDPKFRTLDAKTQQPIRQKLFSPTSEEEVEREDTLKGYEVSKERYVVVTDEELDSVAVERRRSIDILAFIDATEVDPVYFDRTYYIAPQENAQKPYALLLEAMKDTGKTALGKIVLSSREHLALLRPAGDALVIELLFYPEDVRSKDDIEGVVRDTKVTKQELDMAKQLVESLSRSFDPNEYENEHKRDLMALIEKKLAGEEITLAPEPPPAAAVPDLMSALKQSLDEAKTTKRTGGARVESSQTNGKQAASGRKRKAPSKGKRSASSDGGSKSGGARRKKQPRSRSSS